MSGGLPLLFIGGIRAPEIAVIVVVLLLIFGATRLPKIGASIGHSLRAFKGAITGQDEADAENPEGKKVESAVKDEKQR